MGELQRLSTEAEAMPLMRTSGGLVLSSEGRQFQTALRREAADGMLKIVQIKVAVGVAKEAMDATADVDTYRKSLANGDAALNGALVEVELTCLNVINRIQRGSAF
jgi:hypothetical protein